MPQIRAPKKPKPKAEESENAKSRVDQSKVVSAYSEEGEARYKQALKNQKRLRILAICVFVAGLITVLTLVILAYVFHWFN